MTLPEDVVQIAEEGPCEEDGCIETGFACWLPEPESGHAPDEPTGYYCPKHAFDNGFCKMCGRFFGGIESFDFGNGWCDDCQSEMDDEYDEDDDSLFVVDLP